MIKRIVFCAIYFLFDSLIVCIILQINYRLSITWDEVFRIHEYLRFYIETLVFRSLFVLPIYILCVFYKYKSSKPETILRRMSIGIFIDMLLLILIFSPSIGWPLIGYLNIIILTLISWLLFYLMYRFSMSKWK